LGKANFCKVLGVLFMKVILTSAIVLLSIVSSDYADSCWTHNGSMMRLEDSGSQRWISYERPKASLLAAGIQRGTLLFNGQKNGNWYSGLSRVFSKYCRGNPLEYYVEGPVLQNPLRITMTGTRESMRQCQSTGNMKTDRLVFTYSHKC
jgi:hypothetical protein